MREGLIQIDGTRGEGGGQLLRGALALAAATGRAFRIDDIRRSRPRPGLMRQHLTAVHATAAICGAHVEGAEVGATTLVFEPGAVRAGEHTFAIGTAGSCVLVLQAIVPALARLASPSRITITGGTHNPLAPTFEYLRNALAPQLAAIGWTVEYTLVRHGFYPAYAANLALDYKPDWDEWPQYSGQSSPDVFAIGHQVFVYSEYTASMPAILGRVMYARGGRVDTEVNHAHHPIVAMFEIYFPWKTRDQVDIPACVQGIVDELHETLAGLCVQPPAWQGATSEHASNFMDADLLFGAVFEDLVQGFVAVNASVKRVGAVLRVRVSEALRDRDGDALAMLRPCRPAVRG